MAAHVQKTVVSKCIFCNIISGSAPAVILRQDDRFIAFQDIKPVSDNHFLVVPKEHIENVKSLNANKIDLIKELVFIGQELVTSKNGDLKDCRMGFHWPPFNSISHLHLHVIFPESKITTLGRLLYRPNSFYFATPEDTISWVQKHRPSL